MIRNVNMDFKTLNNKLALLDLFSGTGGFSHALHDACRSIAYADINEDARALLKERMHTGDLDKAPIFGDIKELINQISKNPRILRNQYNIDKIDVMTGGFPCQDISVCNIYGAGFDGKRSRLVFDALNVAQLLKIPVLIFENSPNILNKGIERLVEALDQAGYKCVYDIYSAGQVGAPHLRKRFYMVAFKTHGVLKARADKVLKKLAEKIVVRDTWRKGYKNDKVVAKTSENLTDIKRRMFLLGNAIVPATAAYAVHTLSKAALDGRRCFLQSALGHFMKYEYPFTIQVPSQKYIPNEEFALGEKIKKNQLSTPLTLGAYITKVGSHRALRIVSNQIMYDPRTLADKIDKNPDHYLVNPRFIEWMMGYPKDWTKINKKTRVPNAVL